MFRTPPRTPRRDRLLLNFGRRVLVAAGYFLGRLADLLLGRHRAARAAAEHLVGVGFGVVARPALAPLRVGGIFARACILRACGGAPLLFWSQSGVRAAARREASSSWRYTKRFSHAATRAALACVRSRDDWRPRNSATVTYLLARRSVFRDGYKQSSMALALR